MRLPAISITLALLTCAACKVMTHFALSLYQSIRVKASVNCVNFTN